MPDTSQQYSPSRQLALIFAFLAFLSLLSGIGLGLWMALDPAVLPRLLRVHGVVNVFGWLSFLMFGATYLILPLFARREARPVLGPVQVAAQLLGIELLTIGFLKDDEFFIRAGWLVYGTGALFFLSAMLGPRVPAPPAVPPSLFRIDGGEELSRLDRRARPLTMTGPLFLIAAAVGLGLTAPTSSLHRAIADLARLAWPAFVAIGVGYHLLPRFTGRIPGSAYLRPLLPLLLSGFLLRTAGLAAGSPLLRQGGGILLGAALLWTAAGWLGTMQGAGGRMTLVRLSTVFLGLGAFLLLVEEWLPPLGGYAVLHALLLGWLTSLAYGVAPRLFPGVLAAHRAPRPGDALQADQKETAQGLIAWLHGSGVLLMLAAFLFGQGPAWRVGEIRPFAWGAVLVTLGALLFLARARSLLFSKP